jgi:hypothetical protein
VSGLESPVNLSLISSGSQFTISDGVNQAGAVGSVFASQTSSGQTSSSQSSGGAGQSYSGVGQVAASNQRAATAVVDGVKPTAPAAQDAATASKTLSSPPAASAGAAVAAPTTGNAPGEIVLNGQLNLDGGH